jgi:hypothetical protein
LEATMTMTSTECVSQIMQPPIDWMNPFVKNPYHLQAVVKKKPHPLLGMGMGMRTHGPGHPQKIGEIIPLGNDIFLYV